MQSFVLFKIPGYLVELDRFSLCLVGVFFPTHLQILPLTPLFSLINAGCGLFVNCDVLFFYVSLVESRPGKHFTLNYGIIITTAVLKWVCR
jgi:hypothetical protein